MNLLHETDSSLSPLFVCSVIKNKHNNINVSRNKEDGSVIAIVTTRQQIESARDLKGLQAQPNTSET